MLRVFIYADDGFPSVMEISGLTKYIGFPSRMEISSFVGIPACDGNANATGRIVYGTVPRAINTNINKSLDKYAQNLPNNKHHNAFIQIIIPKL